MNQQKLLVNIQHDTSPEKIPKILPILKTIKQQFQIVEIENANLIVVIGGDGFMTDCIRIYVHLRIPFWGINCGTIGFLLNDIISHNDLKTSIEDSQYIKFPLLHATIIHEDGSMNEALAFNDVYTDTIPGQCAKHIIEVNGENVFQKRFGSPIYIGDGILISTPGGCTAYNMSAGGAPILAKDNIFGITPICPSTPHRTICHPFAISNKSIVTIHMLENTKRKHAVITDNQVFYNVTKVEIKRADDYARLGFCNRENYYLKALRFFSLRQNGGSHG